MEQKKTMNTAEYLEHLATEEKRSALLAEMEADPAKKKAARKNSARLKKLIKRVKKMAGGGIETATLKTEPIKEEEE